MPQPLLIIGASVRAAASSAIRAGFEPYGIDLFRDLDLPRRDQCLRARPFPDAVLAAAEQMPDAPWMYTGAFENHLAIVKRLSRQRTLYGNAPDVLRSVRDPRRWTDALRNAGLSALDVRLDGREVPRDGTWICKPLRSSAGTDVGLWSGDAEDDVPIRDRYYQRYVGGRPCSGVFVGAAGRSVFLGATEQRIGSAWCGASPFQYAGSIGPLQLTDGEHHDWSRVGDVLAKQFGVMGLFGVDAIRQGKTLWAVEINPRITASVEVLERADGFSAVEWHVAACRDQQLPSTLPHRSTGFHGKAIFFAPRDLVASKDFVTAALDRNAAGDWWPTRADIPEPGSTIRQGSPVLTLFASGSTEEKVRERLEREARRIEFLLR